MQGELSLKFVDGNGLEQTVVKHFHSDGAAHVVVAGNSNESRGAGRSVSNLATHVSSVGIGQSYVEENKVEDFVGGQLERRRAVISDGGAVSQGQGDVKK
ncbi:hypothetical protein BTHE68_63040 (plasmid) [Burkholderia sp. THE68]|nr:hypothetical protein BTHE68_63040 [Burkholderia sp. THE68]